MNSNLADLVETALENKRRLITSNKAFTEIVKRFQNLVFGYAYGFTGNSFISNDIAQEVFIKAYNHLEQLRCPDAFPGWIKRIAWRECLKVSKQKKEITVPIEKVANLKSVYKEPQTDYEMTELRDGIFSALSKLPEIQRTIIILYYIDRYSLKEIAGFLNIGQDTAKKRLQRARDNLKADMPVFIKNELTGIRPSTDGKLVERINFHIIFRIAAKSGRNGLLEQIIADIINPDEYDPVYEGLKEAAKDAQFDVLEQMIADGFDIDKKDSKGKTLLNWAITKGHKDAIRILSRYRAVK